MLKRTRELPNPDALLELESSLLRSLLAVADCGSFVGAAGVLHRTPSAISMQMKKLESQIGHRIFARKGRSIVLTPTGEALLTYARRVAGIAEEMMLRFNRVPLSKVRLGIPDDYAVALLPPLLDSLATRCPQVEIDVTCRDSNALFVMLDTGELDVALITPGHAADRVAPGEVGIYRDRLAWAGLPDGSAHLQRPLPIAVLSLTCPWRRTAIDALDTASISYRIVCTSNNFAGQIASVLAGRAVSPVPLAALPPGLAPFGPEHGLPPIGPCSLDLWRSPHASGELGRAVTDHIRAYFQSRELA